MTTTRSTFSHGALFYDDLAGFLAGTVPFLEEGLTAGEPALVAVAPEKIEALRAALPDTGGDVLFADMTQLGRNPGRLISAWVDFVREHAGASGIRGIGEPVWRGRTRDEIVECQRHEALLNVAFADHAGLELLCPYDQAKLDDSVVAEAHCSHPLLVRDGEAVPSQEYDARVAPFVGTLPEPPDHHEQLDLDDHRLGDIRRAVTDEADAAGIAPDRGADLVLAVSEAVTNSLRHAGGKGVLRMWREARGLVCEVRDRGRLEDPLVGRLPVPADASGGRGLWLINQLCDLVQIRSSGSGTLVRMHVSA